MFTDTKVKPPGWDKLVAEKVREIKRGAMSEEEKKREYFHTRNKAAKTRRSRRYAKETREGEKQERRTARLLRKYNISLEEYEEMRDAQGGCCAVCQTFNEEGKLCIDHDHKTGQLRGLLCSNCNSLLGFSKDNIEVLVNAIQYLERHKGLSS